MPDRQDAPCWPPGEAPADRLSRSLDSLGAVVDLLAAVADAGAAQRAQARRAHPAAGTDDLSVVDAERLFALLDGIHGDARRALDALGTP